LDSGWHFCAAADEFINGQRGGASLPAVYDDPLSGSRICFAGNGAGRANPPNPEWFLDYYLKSSPKDGITLEILDAKGAVIRKYSSKKASEGASPDEEEFGISRPGEALPVEAGLNRFVWDMRSEAPARVPGAVSWGGRPSGRSWCQERFRSS